MKKILIIILFACSMSSCDKFLDVRPDEKVYEEEVFQTERGFTKALSGVYRSMGTNALYKYELKVGAMDLLVGYWTISSLDVPDREMMDYKYSSTNVQGRLNGIWIGLYSCIHQINIIIRNLPNIEKEPNYGIIAGEAYGLRAFLHLELLKVFGPVIKQEGLSAEAIPYYLTDDRKAEKFRTAKEVLDLVEADLQLAAGLLKDDPIVKIGRAGNLNDPTLGDYSALFDRRGIRMNLYAVKALLARKSIWEGDLTTAYQRATELIEELKLSKAVRFISVNDLQGDQKDLHFSTENIFALYCNTAIDIFTAYFQQNQYEIAYQNNLDRIYTMGSGDWNDIRFNWGIGGFFYTYFSKYFVAPSVGNSRNENYSSFELQMINLPELYLIAAEAKEDEDPAQAIKLLEELRLGRSIFMPLNARTSAEVKQVIIDEVRREYIGEGYLFSFYKRKFLPIPVTGKVVPASLAIFKIPIPADEYIYNR